MARSRSFPAMTEKQRTHRKATSQAMQRIAAASRCPSCNRKFAMRTLRDAFLVVKVCRWCGHEKKVWSLE